MTTLDKIRDEIEQIKPYELPWDKRTPEHIKDMVLEIVEKYADQEPKTGHWLFPYGDKRYKKCSVCGRIYYSIPHDSNYCPNCGCRMVESQESEE